ncbi:X-Pro dipeptidyl-peptidase [Planctomycetaceae bacterium SCGC AG-212-F19]|nr:X-Pro dipeptidyl-peptidase [Planctomycetaceae bacterium SCGC AG-212-F19]
MPVISPLDEIKAAYTKYEFRIPMRDGKKLFTAVYVPKDDAQKYPIMLKRTPYSCRPYGVDQYADKIGPSPLFSKAGYIFAIQDVRGRWMSEGEYVNVRPHIATKKGPEIDESTDTYDTIEWLVKNVPNNNGKVGITGISYPGFYTAAGMIDAHPALKAVSPQAPVIDWFMGDDWHHNGALFLPHVFNFMANFGKPRPEPIKKVPFLPFDHGTPDGYAFFLKMGPLANADTKYFKGDVAFWNEVMKHGTYDDFWKARNLRTHMKNIKPAVMTVGGWFDAENLFGAVETFKAVESGTNNGNILVMGPWQHGGWEGGRDTGEFLGNVKFNSKTCEYYREQIELPFFEYHLKGKSEMKHPKAWVFETGTNVWRKHQSWPPKEARPHSFYMGANGQLLGPGEPGSMPKLPISEEAFDEYVSDPAKPVPFIDKIGVGMLAEYMVGDQRHAARRPDVLVYQTDVVEQDLTIAGPIQVDLYVSTTGTDADWIVKVIDVYPEDYPDPNPNPAGVRMGGFQQLVRGDVMRGKFRSSFEKPEPFTPGKPTLVKFTMPDMYHTFRPGHRLMMQVQSSWFPLVDRNPQTFVDIYTAKEADFKKATQRVYRSSAMPSRITVLVRP